MKNYLGIDLGVKNIGFALTNEDYEVVSVGKKRAMGVLSFEEAKTAADRRGFRTARRRLQRRQYRVSLLQEIFNDEIMKKDPNFLRRLHENDLLQEHRSGNLGKDTVVKEFSLFNDKSYNDKKFYKQYPTIYHLRKALLQEAPNDIRLFYLAVHHIIKYRGHFLLPDELESNDKLLDIKPTFESINDLIRQKNEEGEDVCIPEFDLSRLDELKDLIVGRGEVYETLVEKKKKEYEEKKKKGKVYITKADKKDKANEVLGAKDKFLKNVIGIIFGATVNLTTLFGKEKYPKDEVKTFNLSQELDEVEDMKLLENDEFGRGLIYLCKEVYNWYIINDLLKGKKYLSDAMVNLYETHKSDLKVLKTFIKTYAPDKYEKVFGEYTVIEKGKPKAVYGCYSKYIGGGRYEGEKLGNNGRIGGTISQEDFGKELKKILENIKDESAEELKQSIIVRIDSGEFMPKIVSKNNSTIPYQLNMIELKQILVNAVKSGKYPFLLESETVKDKDGKEVKWTNVQKIASLLSFRIPYYVGPVKNYKDDAKRSKNAWAVRNGEGRITPWSFDVLIDKEGSNKKFIDRMTNNCTYLKKAKSLAKNSVLFSKFNCLNELNVIKINGERMPVDVKKKVFNEVYMIGNPTVKKIQTYLVQVLGYDKDIKLSGFDDALKANMNSYLTYKRVLGDKVDEYPEMIDDIIYYSTIHTESKMVASSIKAKYSNKLTQQEIDKIKGFRFSGWGSLSAELLKGYKYDGIKLCYDGEYMNLIDIMYETDKNLQEILFDKEKCNFEEALKKYNDENGIVENNNITIEDIDELYCSPSVKRCIWQAFNLIKDIVKQSKIIPDRIFLESCRKDDDKKEKTKKRRDIILDLYNQNKELKEDKEKCKKDLENCNDMVLKSKKYYLYFLQLGKCAYSGRPINLNNLSDYDIDHIIPQAKVKDDSFDNMVLVEGKLNKEKSDTYPLPSSLRQDALWKSLVNAKLMSNEKYSRLIRTKDITKEEQEKFINRQLVETNQTVKLLRDLLVRYFKGKTGEDYSQKIVLSKASNVSDFRKDYGLTKSRDVNDFHHACDAYLNVVVGNILYQKFNIDVLYKDKDYYIGNNNTKTYNFRVALNNAVKANDKKVLKTINKEVDNNDVRIVKWTRENKGELYKATLFDAKDNASYPICQSKIVNGVEMHPKSDISKYGGYKTSGTAYFLVVDSYDKKGKEIRSIEDISVYEDTMIKANKLTFKEIFEKRGLKNAELAKIKGLNNSKLKIGSLLEIFMGSAKDKGKFRVTFAGISGSNLVFHNANQLTVSKEINNYFKEIAIIVDKVNEMAKFIKETDDDGNKINKELEKNTIAEFLIHKNELRGEDRKKNHVKEFRVGIETEIVVLTKEKNMEIYEFFIEKLSRNPYKHVFTYSSLLDILVRAKEDFASKNIYQQIVLLQHIICAFQCNPRLVDVSDLSYIDNGKEVSGGKNLGCVKKNSNTVMAMNVDYIRQSRSGLAETRIRITK